VSAVLRAIVEPGFFSSSSVQLAALVGGVVAVVAGTVGVFTVIRGQAFAGDWVAAICAETALNNGSIDEALRLAENAVAYARNVGGLFAEGITQRVWAQALAAQNPNDAHIDEHLRTSLSLLEECEARPEIARTQFAWGKVCRTRGDEDGAREHFQKAAAQFEASGLTRELEETRALLSEVMPQ